MLHSTDSSKHPPQMVATSRRRNRKISLPKQSALQTVVRAEIMPVAAEPDLLDLMCYLLEDNDIGSTVAIYEAFKATADVLTAAINQPRTSRRASDYLENECSRARAKAYLVADFLKDMGPDKHTIDFYADTLLNCASQMGATVTEIAAIASEIAALPLVGGGRR